jgi:short-subunit dehydrogenase
MTSLNIVLSGATGGIGRAMALEFAAAGHRLILLGRDAEGLAALRISLAEPERHHILLADLSSAAAITDLATHIKPIGPVDVLINNAGVAEFGLLSKQQDDALEQMLQLNLLAPMRLCRAILPMLCASSNASIINVGSSFGSIGYAGFTSYCASKFGLRGFTEALQRELADSAIAVHYLAPRAVRTKMNSAAVVAMNKALGNSEDAPEVVARAALRLLNKRQSSNRYLGWPEKFFIRLNSVFPSVVTKALNKQLPKIKRFAKQQSEAGPA